MGNKYKFWLPAVILIVGLSCFIAKVWADTASTAVTVGNTAPSLSAVSLNGGSNITLTEGTFKWASTSMTVTDNNGCSTISSITAKMYLASSTANNGTLCSQNDNNCYLDTGGVACVATTTGNTCAGGSDTSAQYDCGFKLWYIAEGTDSTGEWASSIWSVSATATDSGSLTGTATNTAEAIEINKLNALDVTSSISFGTLSAGSDTGATNKLTYATTTGNSAIDLNLDSNGPNMCTDYATCSGSTIAVGNEEYSLSAFTWGAGTDLTDTPAAVELTNANPSSTTTPEVDIIYWGIGIPGGQTSGDYTGQNLFTAVSDI